MNYFKKIPLYIRISVNSVEVINLLSGNRISQTSILPFSSARSVIDNFNILEKEVTGAVTALLKTRIGIFRQITALIQLTLDLQGGLLGIEKRSLHDLGSQIGAVKVIVLEHFKLLSDQEALAELG